MNGHHLILAAAKRKRAIQKSERGVQQDEHLVKGIPEGVRWDDLRLMETLAVAPSFRQAAKTLKVSVNTVRNRLSRLESEVGSTMLRRSRDGIALSPAGEELVNAAREMRQIGNAASYEHGNQLSVAQREMRIACSEGLGEFWLTPRLPLLQEMLPGRTISLHNEFDQTRIHSRERDVCVGFTRPTDPDLVVSRIACLHFGLYASESYLRRFGQPDSFDDAISHRFVLQDAPGLHTTVSQLFLGEYRSDRIVAVKVNTSYSLYRAVVDGVGIGALPTYVRSVSRRVRPLRLPVQLKFDLWLSYDPSLRDSLPVRHTIDWIMDAFDTDLYPWFGDSFIHPIQLEESLAAVPEAAFDHDSRFL